MNRKETGRRGEDEAARMFESKGYVITARNYRTRLGEIDVIVQNGRFLVFAEVKTRARGFLVSPREAVDRRKQLRVISAAEQFLCENPSALQPRFDVVEVVTDGGEVFRAVEVRHIENAFSV